MDDQKPVIDPEVKDYTSSNKKSKTIYIALVLTIIFLGCFAFVGYRMNKMLGQANHVGDPLEETNFIDEEETTETEANDINIELKELDDYLVFFVTNNNTSTIDFTLHVNTYVGDEISDTIFSSISALAPSYKSVIFIKRSELGIYDSYKYTYVTTSSVYKSAQEEGLTFNETVENTDNFNLTLSNTTGSTISFLEVAVLYYNGSELVDFKTKTLYGVESSANFSVAKSTKEYDSTEFIFVEAYYN